MELKKVTGVLVMAGLAFSVFNLPKNSTVPESKALASVKESPVLKSLIEASNSDGQLRLTGESEQKGGEVRYRFNVVDNQKNVKYLLFETTVEKDRSFTIPFNSWSSDNKHLFIETKSLEGRDYYVFNTDAGEFQDGLKYLDVGDYWNKSKNSDLIREVSGWAGPDQLMVYTIRPDGSDGLAYWFIVSVRKFLQVREF